MGGGGVKGRKRAHRDPKHQKNPENLKSPRVYEHWGFGISSVVLCNVVAGRKEGFSQNGVPPPPPPPPPIPLAP